MMVARTLAHMLPPNYTSAGIHACARQLSDKGLRPDRSHAVHLPPGNIVKHFYQNIRAIKADADSGIFSESDSLRPR